MIELIKNNSSNKNITTFLNPFSYLLSRNKKTLLESFDIKIDGGMLVLLLNLFGFKFKRKSFDMTSLAPVVFNLAINNNKSVYFIGSKPKVIDLAIKNIKKQFPELKICGYIDGYITQDQRSLVLDTIISLKADYVICGMGTPLQEQFLIDLQKYGWTGRGYTCGGFLHQTANGIKYYPGWVNVLGLRAFFRMYDEPKLIRRYFIIYPYAVIIILYDLIKDKFS
tara:strand:+ start:1079 stop:1750 length:672 start_codon:yes stop_codon:yes gene_type:complete